MAVGASLIAMVAALPSAADATPPPAGVHVDPGSPAGKEYAIPINQGRATGANGASTPRGDAGGSSAGARAGSSSESATRAGGDTASLFGDGITPASAGTSRGGSDHHGPSSRRTSPRAGVGASRREAEATAGGQGLLRQEAASVGKSGNGDTFLVTFGGPAAILVIAGGIAVVSQRRRRTGNSTTDGS